MAISIFLKIHRDITAQVALPMANGKNLQEEKFLIILFGYLWVIELTYKYIFPSSSL
jgi:hypothetical protein